ncbi:MAG: hypothetical protein ACFWTZ_00040 [Burkholderia sp.]|jgi:hypothetical protein
MSQTNKKPSNDMTEGSYALTRFNSVKHGLRSEAAVLPHESAEDYASLQQELMDEYQPQGITEKALVQELAATIWRKRRVLRAEAAQVNMGINGALAAGAKFINSAAPFDLHVNITYMNQERFEQDVRDLLALGEDELRQHREELAAQQHAIEEADACLDKGGRGAAKKALQKLTEEQQDLWYEEDRDEDAASVSMFIHGTLQSDLDEKKALAARVQDLREQAIGMAVNNISFEQIARYEAHLDRKFERILSILLKLKEMKADKEEYSKHIDN